MIFINFEYIKHLNNLFFYLNISVFKNIDPYLGFVLIWKRRHPSYVWVICFHFALNVLEQLSTLWGEIILCDKYHLT